MTRYIVDASIVAQYLVEDNFTKQVTALFRGLSQNDDLLTPEFCLIECTNVLWKQVRFNNVPREDAILLANNLLSLPLILISVADLLPRSLQIGLEQKLAVYDSSYLALAEKLKYPLITTDNKQEQAARSLGLTIKPITDFTT